MRSKIKIYHFHNGSGGGVLSVIKNILQFSSNPAIENHIIYTINQDVLKEYKSNHIAGAVSENIFYFSPRWNLSYTCKKLAKLVSDKDSLIVAHDWLELGMVSKLGLQNPVIFFLHGDYEYYYKLAKLHEASIDSFITVAQSIENKLFSLLPNRKLDINYLRFPVADNNGPRVEQRGCHIAFIGRLSDDKGYPTLPLIESILKQKGLNVFWHVIGEKQVNVNVQWQNNSNVNLYGNLANKEVNELLLKMDFFILPSKAEGTPVTLIEAMKAGAIPLVNNIDGGIQELVINAVTGYKVEGNKPEDYANHIQAIVNDDELKNYLRDNAAKMANKLFAPILNTLNIEKNMHAVFLAERKIKSSKKVYSSGLDKKWLPNSISSLIRSLK